MTSPLAIPMKVIGGAVTRAMAPVPQNLRQYVMPVVAILIAAFVVPPFGAAWVVTFTQVAIMVLVTAGANVLYGRVGLATLCQIGLMAVGTWVTLRIEFLTGWPLPVVWVIGALVTMAFGVIVGLPALRLGGLQLAMITLMAAGGFSVLLNGLKFPNGGPGFKGLVESVSARGVLGRPAGFEGDNAFYFLCIGIAVLGLLVVLAHLRGRPGRAWAAIRQSEAAAIAAGIDVTRYKLWAIALASFLTGFAGGVYASFVGSPSQTVFQIADNVTVFAVVIIGAVVIGGRFSLWGAVVAALLKDFLPQFLKTHLAQFMDRPDRIGIILFGIGVLANLIGTTRAARKKGLTL